MFKRRISLPSVRMAYALNHLIFRISNEKRFQREKAYHGIETQIKVKSNILYQKEKSWIMRRYVKRHFRREY